jgi:hypothetical protein
VRAHLKDMKRAADEALCQRRLQLCFQGERRGLQFSPKDIWRQGISGGRIPLA